MNQPDNEAPLLDEHNPHTARALIFLRALVRQAVRERIDSRALATAMVLIAAEIDGIAAQMTGSDPRAIVASRGDSYQRRFADQLLRQAPPVDGLHGTGPVGHA